MTAEEALQRIADRALAQRDLQAFESARPDDRFHEAKHHRPELPVGGQLKRRGIAKELCQNLVTG